MWFYSKQDKQITKEKISVLTDNEHLHKCFLHVSIRNNSPILQNKLTDI